MIGRGGGWCLGLCVYEPVFGEGRCGTMPSLADLHGACSPTPSESQLLFHNLRLTTGQSPNIIHTGPVLMSLTLVTCASVSSEASVGLFTCDGLVGGKGRRT